MKTLSDFTNLYSLSKTLRFELIPEGKTLEHIQKNGLLEQDSHRAESYVAVKKIVDEYHKAFIENALNGLKLTSLDDYFLFYNLKRDDIQKKQFADIHTKLRRQIADSFVKQEGFKNLFAKELIKDDLQNFVQDAEQKDLVREFETFTTYFKGFHENRKNMYAAEEKSTAIAYRLIHQNLPRFIDNMRAFEKVKNSPISEKFSIMITDNELGPVIQLINIEDAFALSYFNETLTQTGIDKYNQLIGGYTSGDEKQKKQGLNEYINLYNQTATKEKRIPKLKPLYKQILSDRASASFIPEQFNNDNEVLESITAVFAELNEHAFTQLKELLSHLKDYDLNRIYLKNDISITDISQKLFSDWSAVQNAVNHWSEINYTGKAKPGTEKYEEDTRKFFKSQDSFSIGFINDCLLKSENKSLQKNIADYFAGAEAISNDNDLVVSINNAYRDVADLLNTPYPDNRNLAQQQKDVDKIKRLLDSIKALQWFIKPLLGKGDEPEKDESFYGELAALWTTLDQITPLYNKVRNYMTRKPYSTEKIKLNFENSTLLAGWDVNKESDNTSVIFKKGRDYYLGIINKKYNKIFAGDFDVAGNDFFEKMEYKLLPGANKMLPKVFFSESRIAEFSPSKQLLENYKNDTHKKGNTFNLSDCHELINFFKTSINKHEDWKKFGFRFSDTSSYDDLSGFYREVEQQGYKITFRNIPADYINKMTDEGKLYLFRIYNKDFSAYSKGTPNMHTLYWKMLFDSENLKDVVYKLNGEAEVFFRKASIKEQDKVIHKANVPVDNKNILNGKKQSTFEYDIVKDKRYTVDKFQFHVPITMNFKARGISNINAEANKFISGNKDLHIIGIDRGERHLLYLTLIDSKGNIKEQFSLNQIINERNGINYKTDYRSLLDLREGNRDEERRNWKTIESIKELKEGYLSQVIHKISRLMVEYNAIVVLEDLNLGFMRGRQKVEKSVYQKFEKMLIDKLNYLVDKKKESGEAEGTLHALQLTNKFESFQKMGKQSGLLFYVPAWNTSKMDPVTGFVNLIDTRYESVDKAKALMAKFASVNFNSRKGYFEFEIDNYSHFSGKAEGTRQQWTICTYGSRIETLRNAEKNSQWDSREIALTEAFAKLFANAGINITKGLKEQILAKNDKSFFETLLHLLKLTLQMRNSVTGTDVDYLISPVTDNKGVFYDSRNCGDHLPANADANGAYNIARKGLWIVEQIKQNPDPKKLKLAISNKEWMVFAQIR